MSYSNIINDHTTQPNTAFLGHSMLISWLRYSIINSVPKMLLVHGATHIGKSAFLQHLTSCLRDDEYCPIYFKLEERPLSDLITDLTQTIQEQSKLQLELPETIDHLGYSFQKEYLPQISPSQLILLMDDAQNIPTTHPFWEFIQRLQADSNPPHFIFTTTQHPALFSEDWNAIFKTAQISELGLPEAEIAPEFLDHLNLTDEAMAQTVSQSGHHPLLLTLLAQQLSGLANEGMIDKDELGQIEDEVLETAVTTFNYWWNSYTLHEQFYLATLAHSLSSGQVVSTSEIQVILDKQKLRLHAHRLHWPIPELIQRRILHQFSEATLGINPPLFHQWLIHNKPILAVQGQLEQSNPLAEKLFQIGVDYLLLNEPKDAAQFFHKAIHQDPYHTQAHIHLGMTLFALGHMETAVSRLEKAYKLNPEEAQSPLTEALLTLAQIELEGENRTKTIAICQRIYTYTDETTELYAETKKLETTVWNYRGDMALQRGLVEKAMLAYEQAGNQEKIEQLQSKQKLNEIAVLENEAHTFIQQEKWDEAIPIYEKILGMAPNRESRSAAEKALAHCMEELELSTHFDEGLRAIEGQNWLKARMSFMHIITKQMNYTRNGRRALELLDQVAKGHAFTTVLTPPSIASHIPTVTVGINAQNAQRIQHTQQLGKGTIYQIQYTPDGTKIAVATALGIYIYESGSAKELQFIATETAVHAIAFSPDGTTLATSSTSGIIQLWWIIDGNPLGQLHGHKQSVEAIAFSPNGRFLLSGDHTNRIAYWRLNDSKRLRHFNGHQSGISALTFSPDGSQFLSASHDKTAILWQVETGEQLYTIKKHQDIISDIVYSPDGEFFATASADKTVRLWQIEEAGGWRKLARQAAKITLKQTLAAHRAPVTSITYSPDGNAIVTASADKAVRVWQTDNGRLLHEFTPHQTPLVSIDIASNGHTVAIASEEKISFWSLAEQQVTQTIEGHLGSLNSLSISPNNQQMATAVHNQVYLWYQHQDSPTHTLLGHTGRIYTTAFSPDGKLLATASADHTVRIWNTKTAVPIRTLTGHEGPILGVAFSPDGRNIATASSDQTIRLWQSDTGQPVTTLIGHEGPVASVTFNSQGNLLASSSGDHTVRLWDIANSSTIQTMNGHSELIWQTCFSADDTYIASASRDQTIRIWRVEDGVLLHKLKNQNSPIWSVQFSPDGTTLASGANDHQITLWQTDTGKRIRTLKGHTAPVSQVLFTPDGEKLISASADGTIRTWGLGGS